MENATPETLVVDKNKYEQMVKLLKTIYKAAETVNANSRLEINADALKETIEKVLHMEVDAKAKRNCEVYKTRDEAWKAFTHTSGYIINGNGWFDTWLFRKYNPNEYEAW